MAVRFRAWRAVRLLTVSHTHLEIACFCARGQLRFLRSHETSSALLAAQRGCWRSEPHLYFRLYALVRFLSRQNIKHQSQRSLILPQKPLLFNGIQNGRCLCQTCGQTCPCCLWRFGVFLIFVHPLIMNSDVISKKSLKREAVDSGSKSLAARLFDVISC